MIWPTCLASKWYHPRIPHRADVHHQPRGCLVLPRAGDPDRPVTDPRAHRRVRRYPRVDDAAPKTDPRQRPPVPHRRRTAHQQGPRRRRPAPVLRCSSLFPVCDDRGDDLCAHPRVLGEALQPVAGGELGKNTRAANISPGYYLISAGRGRDRGCRPRLLPQAAPAQVHGAPLGRDR
jgi:hypothetical protein